MGILFYFFEDGGRRSAAGQAGGHADRRRSRRKERESAFFACRAACRLPEEDDDGSLTTPTNEGLLLTICLPLPCLSSLSLPLASQYLSGASLFRPHPLVALAEPGVPSLLWARQILTLRSFFSSLFQTKRTKKVGITGKYGTRYGASLRKTVKKMEVWQHGTYTCDFCGKVSSRVLLSPERTKY